MLDTLEKVRADVRRWADAVNQIAEPPTVVLSPCGMYRLTIERHSQGDTTRNWVMTKIMLSLVATEMPFLTFFTDNDDTFYAWLYRDKKPYLLLPECQGGQSIIDLEPAKLTSYYNYEDLFIWIAIYPSPSGRKIAVGGCYWACPFEVVIYDCAELTTLPYPILFRQDLEPPVGVLSWQDDFTVVTTDVLGIEQIVWVE